MFIEGKFTDFSNHYWAFWQVFEIFAKNPPEQDLRLMGWMRAFYRCSHHRYSIKDVLNNLAKFTEKHLCLSLFLIKLQTFRSSTLLKKETPTQVFSYEFCEIFKNTSPILKNISDELLLLLTNCFSVFDHVVGLVLNNVNQHE